MFNLSISQLKKGYANKDFSPIEITNAYLQRMQEYSHLHAFITITAEQALKEAAIAEQKYMAEDQVGLLEGIPISYKDNIFTKNVLTTNGSKIDKDFIPQVNAGIVDKLRREGAIGLGKTNLHEYAFGITSENHFYGSVKNPWNEEYTPGGSSGGAGAAIAASLCLAAIGTDTAGSIRIPAAATGVIGLKATTGLIDTSNVTSLSQTLDHVGPLTKNMSDLKVMLEAMTGILYHDAFTEDIRGVRIGVPTNYFNDNIEEHTNRLVRAALKDLESLGAILIEIEVPFQNKDLDLSFPICMSEASVVHEQSIQTNFEDFGKDVQASLKLSQNITAQDYLKALKRKIELSTAFEKLFEKVDVIATPTVPDTTKKIGERKTVINGITDSTFNTMTRLPVVFSLTGQPALSIPCGVAPNGLPVGIQLAATKFNEKTLLRTGYAYEQAFLQSFYKIRNEKTGLSSLL